MHVCDLDFVVRLHREEFSSNIAARLGSTVLRAYYRSFVMSPHAVAYAAEHEGRMVGFLVGIVRLGAHRRRLLRRDLLRLGGAAAVGAAAHPVLATTLLKARLARHRAGRGETGSASHAEGGAPEPVIAVLSHVAVSQRNRGLGIGAALVQEFEREAWSSGATRLCLATVDGSGAATFYERRGWILAGRRTTFDHRRISLYELDLSRRRTE